MSRSHTNALYDPTYTGPRLFGAPVGEFSAFQTVLMTLAVGVASFFAATFVGIVTLLFLMLAAHRTVDFTITYKYMGLPFGILMLVATGGYLGTLLARRVVGRRQYR